MSAAYTRACSQFAVSPEATLVQALADGADAYSTSAIDTFAAFAQRRDRALFALCAGVRSSVSLQSVSLEGLYAPGGDTLWTVAALLELSAALKQTPNITRLSLASNRLDDRFAEPLGALLGQCKQLTDLSLAHNEFDIQFAKSLCGALAQGLGSLRRLDVSNLPLLTARAAWGPELGRAIASAPSDGSLASLRASVHSASALALLEGAARSPRLTSIALTHARLAADVLSELPRLLAPGRPCSRVCELDLTFAYIGDAGAMVLATILAAARAGASNAAQTFSYAKEKRPTSPRQVSGLLSRAQSPSRAPPGESRAPVGLRKLVLAHCAIYAPGGLALVKALETNRTLATLDLTSNPLGDQFARALAARLESSHATPLTSVVLTRTFIADAGVALLADAVRANRSITNLGDLSDLPALVAPRRLLELAVAQNAELAGRVDAAPEAARKEALALVPAEEAELRAQVFALRGELRQAQLSTDDATSDLHQELERAAGEAEQANALLEATIKRNKQLRDRCSALELELAQQRDGGVAHSRRSDGVAESRAALKLPLPAVSVPSASPRAASSGTARKADRARTRSPPRVR